MKQHEVSFAEGVAVALGRLPLTLRREVECTLDLIAWLPRRTGTVLETMESAHEVRSVQAAQGVVMKYQVPKRKAGQKIQGFHKLLVLSVEHVDL